MSGWRASNPAPLAPSGCRSISTARESVAIEEGQASTYLPIDSGLGPEPIEALENTGEFPTLTDQGEQQIPHHPDPNDATSPLRPPAASRR